MTIEEFRNMDVKIRGYTMPDDNAPDFYKRCKVSEALDIMKDFLVDFPKQFSKLTFEFNTIEEESIFSINRDLENVFLGDNNFDLTKEFIKKGLGIEE